jgi:hypothetical protein
VHIVLDIFLAGPDNLYGTLDVLGDLDSANDTINLQPIPTRFLNITTQPKFAQMRGSR